MEAKDIVSGAIGRHRDVLDQMEVLLPEIERGADILVQAVKQGNVLYTCGNGGSAADAQHFVAEYTCKYKDDRRPLPAVALTTNTSHITAVGNDFSFEDIFARQLQALAREGDVLVAITTSGGSKNVLQALAVAKNKRMKIIVMTGERGGNLRDTADVLVAVPSSETARIQEMHELIYHAWCEFVDATIKG
jgi:D-sedoheptulose 7-phosphate isomerase